jgi:hypothetical protein
VPVQTRAAWVMEVGVRGVGVEVAQAFVVHTPDWQKSPAMQVLEAVHGLPARGRHVASKQV